MDIQNGIRCKVSGDMKIPEHIQQDLRYYKHENHFFCNRCRQYAAGRSGAKTHRSGGIERRYRPVWRRKQYTDAFESGYRGIDRGPGAFLESQ